MEKRKIYLASPFFTAEQREVKERIKNHLEKILPDDVKIADPQKASQVSKWEDANATWGMKTFLNDNILLDECSEVIAIDWGLYGDCGTAWEIGYAYAKQKKICVITPNAVVSQPHSLMVVNGSDNFITEERFLSFSAEYGYKDLWDNTYFANGVMQK